MAIARTDPSRLIVSSKDAGVVVPPWYRPGYPKSLRGAAWSRLRPSFRHFLQRKITRGEIEVYRPSPKWSTRAAATQDGSTRIFQAAPDELPDEGEFVLFDPEPASTLTANTTWSERVRERPVLFAAIGVALTLTISSIFSPQVAQQ